MSSTMTEDIYQPKTSERHWEDSNIHEMAYTSVSLEEYNANYSRLLLLKCWQTVYTTELVHSGNPLRCCPEESFMLSAEKDYKRNQHSEFLTHPRFLQPGWRNKVQYIP